MSTPIIALNLYNSHSLALLQELFDTTSHEILAESMHYY